MEFFVEKAIDRATSTEMARVKVPQFDDAMDAVKDLRQQYRELGTYGWMYGKGWRHVASISGPVLQVAEILDPEFLNGHNKRDFYRWIDEHPEYLTYDRRKQAARGDMLTFSEGNPIV